MSVKSMMIAKIKEELKRLLSKIMIRYNVDEEYIRNLLQEEI